jgi:hypothetical protein
MKNWIWMGLTIILMSSCSMTKYSVGDCFDISLGTLEIVKVKKKTYVLTLTGLLPERIIERAIKHTEITFKTEGIESYRCEK